jgi:glyoxylase-like metal-dependent hydrolase (beta-lactamase superfamily II)
MLKIGEIEITSISDGPFPAPLDSFVDFDRAETERLTGRRIDETVILPVNCYLLKLGPKWALIDTGCGPTMGPQLGQLPSNLRALGVAPEAIDYVLLTHIHPDHALGLIDAAGDAVYPNAELLVHEQEADFWLNHDPNTDADERIKRNRAKGQGATGPYRERMRTMNEGEMMPGVSAVPLAGHTPGHTGWHIHSGSEAPAGRSTSL